MGRFVKLVLWAVLLLMIAPGCGDDRAGDDDDNDNGGDGDADGDDDDDDGFDTDGFDDDDDDDDTDIIDTEVCDLQEIQLEAKLPKLMILEDVSGSMVTDEDGNPVEKWNQAKAALTNMVNDFEKDVDFGLDIFPDGSGFDNCGVSNPVLADCADENAQTIIDHLNGISPDGATPLRDGMQNFTNTNYAPSFTSVDANSYLLIVSDGQDTCGGIFNPVTPQVLGTLTARLLNDHDIKSFVIGFGDGVDPDQLNAIAENGGTDFNTYLIAEDQASLEAALESIVDTLISCIYEVLHPDDPNVDVDNVNFYFVINGVEQRIGWDDNCAAGKGWTWRNPEHTIVEFCAEACETLQSGVVESILIEYGCDPVPIE